MLMISVQRPVAASYESQVEIHTSTTNTEISLAREFQKHISYPTWSHGLLDLGNDIKLGSKWKWNERDYHVHDRKYVSHISVKFSYATTQFQAL